jgi:hypothetical protein
MEPLDVMGGFYRKGDAPDASGGPGHAYLNC